MINKYINEVTKFQEHLDNAKNLKIKIRKVYINYQKSKIENQKSKPRTRLKMCQSLYM